MDDVVVDWLRNAESVVYECPPSSQRIPSLEYAYDELVLLEAEVDVVVIDAGDGRTERGTHECDSAAHWRSPIAHSILWPDAAVFCRSSAALNGDDVGGGPQGRTR